MSDHAAKHLIIGGGIVGCSIAYHLARNGERDVVLLEKSALTEGATWHAAGLVGQLRSSRNATRMLQKSIALYDRIEEETGMATDWKKVGSLRLAASRDRLMETRRLVTMARSFGLDMEMITPGEAKELFPFIDIRGLEGATFIPSDGHVDPAGLCQAIAAGARKYGAQIRQGVKVLDFRQRGKRIVEILTSEGVWEAEQVVLAAGMWSRELGAKLGIAVPACAIEHQYIVTEPIRDFPDNMPTLRDPDRLVYYKPDAGGRLVVGGYEPDTVSFGEYGIDGEFVRQLLPENLDRFQPLAENAAKVTPILNEVGVRSIINGPMPDSADGDVVLGRPPGIDNLMLATGFVYGIAAGGGAGEMIAEWIVDGRPSFDLWPFDVRRFSPHHATRSYLYPRALDYYAHHYKLRYPGAESEVARAIRTSPLYERLKRAGAVYGSKNGWERPLWFAPDGVARRDQLAFTNPGWKRYAAAEVNHMRAGVALIDQSSFAKFELVGKGALAALQRLAVSNMDRPVGTVIYTQMCNERGGIEADLTITRLGAERFYIITGAGFGVHDSDWIARHLPTDGSVHCNEVTSSLGVLNLCGPKARKVLAQVSEESEEDVSNAAFPFATMRPLTIGAAPVRAIRIGYVGELGWELHVPAEFVCHVYDLLWQAGEQYDIVNMGYRAIDMARLEKGYLYWSSDITPDYTPIEAGLGGRVHLKSKGDFIGRQVLERQKKEGVAHKLSIFSSDDDLPVFGGESILHEGKVVSLATSAGWGPTCNRTICYGYLPVELAGEDSFELEAFMECYPLKRVDRPPYDPENKRLKA